MNGIRIENLLIIVFVFYIILIFFNLQCCQYEIRYEINFKVKCICGNSKNIVFFGSLLFYGVLVVIVFIFVYYFLYCFFDVDCCVFKFNLVIKRYNKNFIDFFFFEVVFNLWFFVLEFFYNGLSKKYMVCKFNWVNIIFFSKSKINIQKCGD